MRIPLLPGKRRRRIVVSVVLLTTALSVAIALSTPMNDVWTALAILLVALTGFHAIAFMTFDCAPCWRAVDYPWFFAATVTVLLTLTNIYESARSAPIAAAQSERRANYWQLIYHVKVVITDSCYRKPEGQDMWTVWPEPYPGACRHIEDLLPQIENAAAREAQADDLSSEDWGRYVIGNLGRPVRASGSWAALYEVARNFDATSQRTRQLVDSATATPRSPFAALATFGALKYWYFAVSFFLGLRLAKITAEILLSIAFKWPKPPLTQDASSSTPPKGARDGT